MRLLKLLLIVVLAVVTVLYGITALSDRLSGDTEAPRISCPAQTLELSVRDPEVKLFSDVTATDRQDGDLTDQIRILGVSKLITEDTAKVTYVVFDSDGNGARCTRYIHYTDYSRPVFAIKRPLVYSANEPIPLLDRLQVTDVIDGDITSSVRVSALSATSDSEVFTVTLQVTNSMGDTARITLPVIMLDTTSFRPDIQLSEQLVYVKAGSSFNANQYLMGVTYPGGTGSVTDVQITSTVDISTPGTYMVYYRYPHNGTVGIAILTVVVQ